MKKLPLILNPKGALLVLAKIAHFTSSKLIARLLTHRQKTVYCRKKEIRTLSLKDIDREELARRILGDDFLSIEEVSNAYGVYYCETQKKALIASVPGLSILQTLRRKAYMLFPTLPTEYNVRRFRIDFNQPYFRRNEEWCLKLEPKFFSGDVVQALQWLIIRKKPYSNSGQKTWEFQQGFLDSQERFPNAPEVMYAFTTYLKVRGVCLLYDEYVRTSSVDDDGRHIIVGHNRKDGIDIHGLEDEESIDKVGALSVLMKRSRSLDCIKQKTM